MKKATANPTARERDEARVMLRRLDEEACTSLLIQGASAQGLERQAFLRGAYAALAMVSHASAATLCRRRRAILASLAENVGGLSALEKRLHAMPRKRLVRQ